VHLLFLHEPPEGLLQPECDGARFSGSNRLPIDFHNGHHTCRCAHEHQLIELSQEGDRDWLLPVGDVQPVTEFQDYLARHAAQDTGAEGVSQKPTLMHTTDARVRSFPLTPVFQSALGNWNGSAVA